jgi:hypothetical protein
MYPAPTIPSPAMMKGMNTWQKMVSQLSLRPPTSRDSLESWLAMSSVGVGMRRAVESEFGIPMATSDGFVLLEDGASTDIEVMLDAGVMANNGLSLMTMMLLAADISLENQMQK